MFFLNRFKSVQATVLTVKTTKNQTLNNLQKLASRKQLLTLTRRGSIGLLSLVLISLFSRAVAVHQALHQAPFMREVSNTPSQYAVDFLSSEGKLTHPEAYRLAYLGGEDTPGETLSVAPPPSLEFLTEEEEEQRLTARLQAKTRVGTRRNAIIPVSTKPNRGFSGLLTGKTSFLMIPVQNSFISSRFGIRNGRQHSGTDFAAAMGTNIVASAAGQVINSGWTGGYGNMIMIDHGNGLKTLYGHCSKLFVKNGDWVRQGETIGKVGNTGHSTGPHLHYEVITDGVPHNPERYLFR